MRLPAFITSTLLLLACFSCRDLPDNIPESTLQVSESTLPVNQEVLYEGFEIPYSIELLGPDEYLVTERMGALYRIHNGTGEKVTGLPESVTFTTDRPYGGMMDISLHPDFRENGLVYLSFVNTDYQLSVVRFKLSVNTAVDVREIFSSDQFCIGSRIEWQDDTHFFLSFGVGGAPGPDDGPQDLMDPRGKIFRLNDDGTIPADNPVFSGKNALPGIWSYGHRDPQGLYYDTLMQRLYANEHGPMGGDELNIIEKGGNYGWPLFSYGLNYDGSQVSDMTEAEASKVSILPVKYWTPEFRLAPSSLLLLRNSNFTDWNDSFLIGGLTYQQLVRYDLLNDSTEIAIAKVGRIRDIKQLPDGNLVILVDYHSPQSGLSGRIIKLTPGN